MDLVRLQRDTVVAFSVMSVLSYVRVAWMVWVMWGFGRDLVRGFQRSEFEEEVAVGLFDVYDWGWMGI